MHTLKDSQLKAASSGKFSDGGNLFVIMTSKGRGKFIFRYSLRKRRREMGLGTYPKTKLCEAREQAYKWRAILRDKERRAESEVTPTFASLFAETFDKLRPTLKGKS